MKRIVLEENLPMYTYIRGDNLKEKDISVESDEYIENMRLEQENEEEYKYYLYEKYEQLEQIINILDNVKSELGDTSFMLEEINIKSNELNLMSDDIDALINELKEVRKTIDF